jgi:hypothetical protein
MPSDSSNHACRSRFQSIVATSRSPVISCAMKAGVVMRRSIHEKVRSAKARP